MLSRTTVTLFLALSCLAGASAEGVDAGTTLHELQRDFIKARALPEGTRPAPPDISLKPLLGVTLSKITSLLGKPDKPTEDYDFGCHAKRCVTYTYGAKESLEGSVEPSNDDSGLETVTVTTGGPWLLVLGVESDRVVFAKWLGQK
jgi:hypothetical protein